MKRKVFIIIIILIVLLFMFYKKDIITFFISCDNYNTKEDTIIHDGFYTFEQSVEGIELPESIRSNLLLIEVDYFGFDSLVNQGQLVVSKEYVIEIQEIFEKLLIIKFPFEKIIPIVKYNWSDSLSMLDNNTSCFNYRTVKNSKRLSLHSYGKAIDINPRLNPYFKNNTNNIEPINGIYNPFLPGTITDTSMIYKIFRSYGWKWGGNWKYSKDYQHFYKN